LSIYIISRISFIILHRPFWIKDKLSLWHMGKRWYSIRFFCEYWIFLS